MERVSLPPPVPAFEFFAETYDAFMGWEGRLAREVPFLVRCLEEIGARRVLDVACGTGRHAVALAQRGYEVEGVDASPQMLERARCHAAEAGVSIPFHCQDLRSLPDLNLAPADALLCLGNTIPQLTTRADLRRALRSFRSTLRPGGLLILHQRNFYRIWSLKERWFPLRAALIQGEEWLLLRFYEFQRRRRLLFQVVWLHRSPEGWRLYEHGVPMRAWFAEDLEREAQGLFRLQALYGRFEGETYEPWASPDLIWVGRAM